MEIWECNENFMCMNSVWIIDYNMIVLDGVIDDNGKVIRDCNGVFIISLRMFDYFW